MYNQCMVCKRRKTGREKLENSCTQVLLKDGGEHVFYSYIELNSGHHIFFGRLFDVGDASSPLFK